MTCEGRNKDSIIASDSKKGPFTNVINKEIMMKVIL